MIQTMKYSYVNFLNEDKLLNQKQLDKFNEIISMYDYTKFFNEEYSNFLIIAGDVLIGFFSIIIIKDYVELSCLYVCEEFRIHGIATEVINDIVYSIRNNDSLKIKYIIANSFVESCMFFLNRGFDFCKINKKLDYKKRNVIKVYKRI